jgi:hypothetical protein
MTTRVYTIEEIELQDWEKPVRIHPLTIKKFRELAEILQQLTPTPEIQKKKGFKNKEFLDVMLEATAFAMKTFEPELGTVEVLEEHVDMPTMERILDIAAGVKLNDPNPQTVPGMAGTS